VYRILLRKPEGRNHSEDPGINGIIISKWIRRGGRGGGPMDWIYVAQDRERWRPFVNAIMNFWMP